MSWNVPPRGMVQLECGCVSASVCATARPNREPPRGADVTLCGVRRASLLPSALPFSPGEMAASKLSGGGVWARRLASPGLHFTFWLSVS